MRALIWILVSSLLLPGFEPWACADVPAPAAVGWGNLFVPGLGATLRGKPVRGLVEATTTLGTYYGGTFLAEEAHFSMDGSVKVPSEKKHISRNLTGQFLQEVGLKTHMYNTFYNYQQASMDPSNAELQKKYEQPLYKGSWDDVLFAPFKWKNLESGYVYVPILLSTAMLYAGYRGTRPDSRAGRSGVGQDSLFAFTQGVGVPWGSAFGEEVLFRGFMQREFNYYTHSFWAAVIMQDILFTVVHTPRLRPGAAVGGIYFGLMTRHFEGNLEPLVAVHFWVDFISGVFNYFQFRRSEGRSAPLAASFSFPF